MRVGIEEFRPERLALAREFRIRTKKSLAEAINVSPANLTKWEAGEHKPEAKHLHDLAWELDFPISWFVGQTKIGAGGERHRSLKSSLKRQKRRMSATLAMMDSVATFLTRYVEFQDVSLPGGHWHSAPSISDAEILAAALECRELFGFGLKPAGDIIDAMENCGVLVSRCEVGGTKIDGVSAWANNCGHPLVLLASDKANATRSRFDAAHELGHLVLHRNVPPIEFDDERDLKDQFDLQEAQAHLFASEFLLPTSAFVSELRLAHLDEFADLKMKWKSSIKMMIMKARKLDIIDDEFTKHLYINYNARGWNRFEPHDDLIAFEHPESVRSALDFVIGGNAKMLHEAEQQTGLSSELLEEVFQFEFAPSEAPNIVNFRR